jgi:hypothetical protein
LSCLPQFFDASSPPLFFPSIPSFCLPSSSFPSPSFLSPGCHPSVFLPSPLSFLKFASTPPPSCPPLSCLLPVSGLPPFFLPFFPPLFPIICLYSSYFLSPSFLSPTSLSPTSNCLSSSFLPSFSFLPYLQPPFSFLSFFLYLSCFLSHTCLFLVFFIPPLCLITISYLPLSCLPPFSFLSISCLPLLTPFFLPLVSSLLFHVCSFLTIPVSYILFLHLSFLLNFCLYLTMSSPPPSTHLNWHQA